MNNDCQCQDIPPLTDSVDCGVGFGYISRIWAERKFEPYYDLNLTTRLEELNNLTIFVSTNTIHI